MAAPPILAARPARERAALRRRLETLRRNLDARYLTSDPLQFVHRYDSPEDREIVGFIASGLAFGNVTAIHASVKAVLDAMGERPVRFVDRFDPARDAARFERFYHRWIRGADIAALLIVLRRMRERSGSIGGFFMEGHRPADANVGASLASFAERGRALAPGEDEAPRRDRPWRGGGGPQTGTVAPFFPSPRDGSTCKRLNLYLRWMVRRGDGLDLGLWTGVPARQLVLPMDTHLVRLSRALGLTRLRTPGWRMAVEATASLALLDPDDPVRYDFALSRLGILDLCMHGRDPLDCRACPPPAVRARR